MATKRAANDPSCIGSLKRYKSDIATTLVEQTTRRTSDLPSPVMRLRGHHGAVLSCNFHPDGEIILSSAADKGIRVFSVFEHCENMMTLYGHTGFVMEARFSIGGDYIFSCSTDMTLAVWDTYTGVRLCQLMGHASFVNSVNSTMKGNSTLLCSGAEDCTVRIWDERVKEPVLTNSTNYPITSTCFNSSGNHVIYAGMHNYIKVWDIRTKKDVFELEGHTNFITGISLSPDGSRILSNSMDSTVRIWDINQVVNGDRCLQTFEGIQHGYGGNLLRCAWSKNCNKIAAGSADCFVYVWDVPSERLQYKLSGPNGIVNDLDFHPKQPVVAIASSDRILYMGEIEHN